MNCTKIGEIKFVNLTPHEVNIKAGDIMYSVPASGQITRVSQTINEVGFIGEIPVRSTIYGEVENLPNPEPGTAYIVSALVAQRVKEREDVYIPGSAIRDDAGRIIACDGLMRV